MSANFAFYIHHHGSGHLMRALAIAAELGNDRITFLGSGLRRFENIIPKHIQCIHLPDDVPGPNDHFAARLTLHFLHYVPMNVEKVAARAAMITIALHNLFPCVLMVDVSVEVTLLATLCGTPTVVMRQNGDRDDPAHLLAYESAQLLVAPCSVELMNPSPHGWVEEKTFFTGGFSKYTGLKMNPDSDPGSDIGVLIGSGGTSIDAAVIHTLACQLPGRGIQVIGHILEKEMKHEPNVTFHGQVDDPAAILSQCSVVVGNAGHNTVMEMADLHKKFICIPEERPFQEQFRKAALLEKNKMAIVLHPTDLLHADWVQLVGEAENLSDSCWKHVISNTALTDLSARLHTFWAEQFQQILH